MIIWQGITLAGTYLAGKNGRVRKKAKAFLRTVKIFLQKRQQLCKAARNVYVVSFFYDAGSGVLTVYVNYKKHPVPISVKWDQNKPQGLCFDTPSRIPGSVITWLKATLLYKIKVDHAASLKEEMALMIASRELAACDE